MTDDRSPLKHPFQRRSDHVPAVLCGLLEWWQKWGLLVTGSWLIVVSLAVLIVAVAFVDSQRETTRQATAACVRTKEIGPYIVDDYARRHVLPPEVLAKYRRLVPSECP